MTPQGVIQQARVLLNDTRSPYRYTDTDMLRFYNDIVYRMLILRPDIFANLVDYIVSGGEVGNYRQGMLMGSSVYTMLDVVSVTKAGTTVALEEVPFEEFTRAKRLWASDTPGIPTKFCRDPHAKTVYYLNPPPEAGVLISILWADYPKTVTTDNWNETMNILDKHVPRAHAPALVDGIVFLAQSVDDEHINSGRAKLFYDSFINLLGVSEQILDRATETVKDTLRGVRNDAQ
jgi:hypothetical protein